MGTSQPNDGKSHPVFPPARPVTICAFARWRIVLPSYLVSVSSLGSESVKLNSSYSRIAWSSGLSTPAPALRSISQDTLRRWEKLACESTYICNQTAGFSRYLSKVQSSMQAQLSVIQAEKSKGKSSEKTSTATDEFQYLLNFSSSISPSAL